MLRKIEKAELPMAMAILEEGRKFQEEQGFIQWTKEYPNLAVLEEDEKAGKGYLYITENTPLAYMCIDFTGEPAYEAITKGQWNTSEHYAVIHRMAISPRYRNKGWSEKVLLAIEEVCKLHHIWAIRVDTDRENLRMQHILKKNGYTHCGFVSFQGSEKLAFEKNLE